MTMNVVLLKHAVDLRDAPDGEHVSDDDRDLREAREKLEAGAPNVEIEVEARAQPLSEGLGQRDE
jgi:hypothetical protein